MPKMVVGKTRKNQSIKKLWKIFFILLIAFSFAKVVLDAVNPIFETLCREQAESIATTISNEQAAKIMKQYQYEDLFSIEKDESGNIKMVKSNIFPINSITSDIGINIQKEINNTKKNDINISLGSFTGINLLSGRGPYVNVKISSIGNVETDLKSEFISQGINQTLHRIYLQVDCKINILTPFNNIQKDITNQILLAENVIVGQIPETYYNLEGFDDASSTLDALR